MISFKQFITEEEHTIKGNVSNLYSLYKHLADFGLLPKKDPFGPKGNGPAWYPEVADFKPLDPSIIVNVTGDVTLQVEPLKKLPVKFGKIGGTFNCTKTQLTSLEGAPSWVGEAFWCAGNELTSLKGIHKLLKHCKATDVNDNPIVTGGIGLILIEGLTWIDANQPAFEIIKKYLGQGKKGLLLCQDELIEAGLDEFAEL